MVPQNTNIQTKHDLFHSTIKNLYIIFTGLTQGYLLWLLKIS